MGLTFNGTDLFDEYGIFVDSSGTWQKPERDREFIHVPGRSGDLILDRGSWLNVQIEYNCHIDNDFYHEFERFTSWLSSLRGYYVLSDDHHPDVYRLAAPEMNIAPTTTFTDKTADFELVFNCKPQQYINDGVDRTVTLDYSAADVTDNIPVPLGWYWDGSPELSVFGDGGGYITIDNDTGTWVFEIDTLADPDYRIVIDFETGNAVIEDVMGEYVGSGNSYFTVTPPSASAPDFPESKGTIIAYHTNPDDGLTTYTGKMILDPRFYRI